MKYFPLAARICLSLVFLNAAINHIKGFTDFTGFVGSVLPFPAVFAVGTLAFQLLGVLSLLLGYKVKSGAWLLILFLIPASVLFHNPFADPSQWNPFLKNIGLIGGLLMIIYSGAGAFSFDDIHQRLRERA